MGLLVENTFIEIASIILFLFWILYIDLTKKYSFWKDKSVAYITPVFPFGSFKDLRLNRVSIGKIHQQFYNKFENARFYGIYDTRDPVLVVKDPDLIERILTKDFYYFKNRFVLPQDTKVDYLHLFNMSGQQWKYMRSKLSPTFTSSKLKFMFHSMSKSGEDLKGYVLKKIETNPILDVKNAIGRFTMDTIASCAFGLDIGSLTNSDCKFYNVCKTSVETSAWRKFKRFLFTIIPFMEKVFRLTPRFVRPRVLEFLAKIILETVDYRKKNKVDRKDFLDLLVRIRHNKKTNGITELDTNKTGEKTGMTIQEITAQSFIFVTGGFETGSATMTFCLYELACNPDVQERLYQEVKQVLLLHEGRATYEALQKMNYMDQVIKETHRRYSSLSILNRTCSAPYQIPDSDLVLEVGQEVIIPTYALHHDPRYYPDPYKFDPERFSPEQERERHPYIYLPFGHGPRKCIGMRFGSLQIKVGLAEMVSNFQFKISSKIQKPLSLNKSSFNTQLEKPLLLHVVKRNV